MDKTKIRKSVVVAGNGPSLKNIDYSRLPKEFDVFRCNQFFFEDKYYLGKNVGKVFFGARICENMYASYVTLKFNKEYSIDDICSTVSFYDYPPLLDDQVRVKRLRFIQYTHDTFETHDKIKEFLWERFAVFGMFPTTGMVAVLMAIAEGYTDIYITGIDMYTGGNVYVYKHDENSKLNQICPVVEDPYIFHSRELEEQCLDFVKTFENITIQTISPDNVLQDIFPLAPVQNDSPYIPEDKPENYLNDIVLTARQQIVQNPTGLKQKIQNKLVRKGLINEWEAIKQNQTMRFMYSCLKVIKALLTK